MNSLSPLQQISRSKPRKSKTSNSFTKSWMLRQKKSLSNQIPRRKNVVGHARQTLQLQSSRLRLRILLLQRQAVRQQQVPRTQPKAGTQEGKRRIRLGRARLNGQSGRQNRRKRLLTPQWQRTAMVLMLQLQRRAPKFQGQESLLEHRRSRRPKSRLRALMPLLSTRIERKIPPRAREHA